MAAAAANEDDDDNAVHSLIGLGFDTVDVNEDAAPTNTTAIIAALREGRRLAGIRRREDRWRRFNMVDTVISHHQAHQHNAFEGFNVQMNNALLASSSSAAAASSYDTSNYFIAEPEPEPEPGDSDSDPGFRS
jgi:hypothetical protein